jgi:general secretion pathway protein C
MLLSSNDRLVLHTATFLVWALAAGCIGYWALQISSNNEQGKRTVATSGAEMLGGATDSASLARLLGTKAPEVTAPSPASSRFSLKGVVSGATGKEAALIAIDDKPARAFRVGTAIEEGLFLQSVIVRQVTLSASKDGPTLMTLEMPALVK